MKNIVFIIALLQFLNLAVSVTVKPKTDPVLFDRGDEFKVTCEVTDVLPSEKVVVTWEKDDEKLEAKAGKISFENTASNYTVVVKSGTDNDAGNYACVFEIDGTRQQKVKILAASNINVETQDNLNFVEGEKLRIPCSAFGVPPPIISWSIGNVTYTNSTGDIILKEDEKKVANAILTMDKVNMTHKGNYTCRGTSIITNKTVEDHTIVRIKDKYAALWPFLGICVEVFVLCAIILIYEKKRNKSELEESDTDQSPDQKNTPDHGKDSNLRHRQ